MAVGGNCCVGLGIRPKGEDLGLGVEMAPGQAQT